MTESARAPVFVVGVPRSGTTLLSAMLNAHSRIAITPETFFMEWALGAKREPRDLGQLSRFLDEYGRSDAFRSLGIESSELLDALGSQETPGFRSLFAAMLTTYADRQGKPRGGEKTPRHYLYVDRILEWFPDCSVIWVVRDPRAVAASLLKVSWAADEVETHAWRWADSNERLARFSGDPRVVTVSYEDLVQQAGATMRHLCAAIGERFEDDMLQFQRTAASLVGDEAHKANVLAPLDTRPLDKWRTQLSDAEVATIEYIAADGMAVHDYEPEQRRLSASRRAAVRSRRFVDNARNVAGALQRGRSDR